MIKGDAFLLMRHIFLSPGDASDVSSADFLYLGWGVIVSCCIKKNKKTKNPSGLKQPYIFVYNSAI